MGFSYHYAKIVGGGLLAAGLIIAVIVLGVEVARLSGELEDLQNDDPSLSSTTTTENPALLDPWDRNYLLDPSIVPEHYDLLIHPDLDTEIFIGKLTLKFEITKVGGLPYLPIHQKGLNITDPELKKCPVIIGANCIETIKIKQHFEAPRNEFYVFLPELSTFALGQYELTLNFNGSLKQPEIVGIYASQYNNGDGHPRKLVTSKFEPTYARRAFPCMDEPDKKATFTVSLVKPQLRGWSALSNMNVDETIPNAPSAGWDTVKFAKSVKMSTYLACFIVSEFTSLGPEPITNPDGTEFEVKTYAPDHLVAKTKFALDAAVSVSKYYIEYFEIPYPLPKLDLIAIPDFVSGAMEHWGLVTFRETNLIVDEDFKVNSDANQKQVGQVIAHEIAHMWFGNLVTMKWWQDLWLNEGFASYVEYKGLNNFKSDWQVMDQFLTADLQPVMAMDAQLSSHPVIQPVDHPDQITEIFDTITYSKGSSVIRMLENFLGETVFQTGITKYLTNNTYGNAETQDLWNWLQVAADEAGVDVNVTRVMNTWTLQMGLPVVLVTYDAAGKVTFKQERFLATPPSGGPPEQESPFQYRWDIPITYTYKDNTVSLPVKWLLMEDVQASVDIPSKPSWIKVNVDQVGFYRVNYEPAMWKQLTLTYAFRPESMSAADRSSLLDDAFSLADSGHNDYSIAMELAEALSKEKNFIPWTTASARFQKMSPLLRGRPAFELYNNFLIELATPLYTSLTWTEAEEGDEFHIQRRLRSLILQFMCSKGFQKCLDQAGTLFSEWLSDPTINTPPANLRQLVYVYGMEAEGTAENWNAVWKIFKTEQDPQERSKLLLSLSSVKDTWLLEKFISLTEDEDNVKGQDYFTVLQNIADNPAGTPIVWDYVRENWEKLVERFTLNSRSLGRLIPRITQNFNTQLKYNEIVSFFEQYPEAGAGAAARKQALEGVQTNINWIETHYESIEKWLVDHEEQTK